MNNAVGAIIEARMASSRLPGKVMDSSNANSIPLIKIMADRLKKSVLLDKIVVATTKDKSDDPLCSFLDYVGIKYYRGSVDNVLQRVCDAAEFNGIDTIVELTGDCPLIDWKIVDTAIGYYFKLLINKNALFDRDKLNKLCVSTTTVSPTYPRGQDVSVFSFSALKEASTDPDLTIDDIENVSYYFYSRNRFSCAQLPSMGYDFEYCGRMTVDYEEDLQFVNEIIKAVGPHASIDNILKFIGSLVPAYCIDAESKNILDLGKKHLSKIYVNDKFRRGS